MSAMKRKAQSARDPMASPVMTPARAWHATMPRAADDHMGLILSVLSVQETAGPAAALIGEQGDDSLLLLMRDGQGRLGLCAVDPVLLAAVIEVQMTGQVGTGPVPPRRPTATDAAIVAGLVDAVCAAFDGAVAPLAAAPPYRGARFAAFLPGARAALMALPEGVLYRARISVDLGAGARQGQIAFLMPAVAAPRARTGAPSERPLGEDLAMAAMEGRVTLDAVLHRFRLPLARIGALKPGDLLALPSSSLSALSVEGADGRRVAGARLGQVDGKKALRISLTAAPDAKPGRRPAAPAPDSAGLPPADGPAPDFGGAGAFPGSAEAGDLPGLPPLPD